MDVVKARPKKHSKKAVINSLSKGKGIFKDFYVVTYDEMGPFGTRNRRRQCPSFKGSGPPDIIRQRIYEKRQRWGKKTVQTTPEKVIVVPDSDSDRTTEEYLTDLKPVFNINPCKIPPCVHLTLEEAFFLSEEKKCMDVYYSEKLLTSEELWDLFSNTDEQFVHNYVIYRHFTNKNWVVKNGIKFGGDYLLYEKGPQFHHASYLVIIDVLDSNSKRLETYHRRSMKIIDLMGLNRLCENSGKKLLICEVLRPDDGTLSLSNFKDVAIREVMMTRQHQSKTE